MRRLMSALIALSLFALCACAAPPSATAPAAQAAAPAAASPPVKLEPATPAAPAAPVQGVPAQSVPAHGVVKIDRSCRSDADCAIKDVGNCCGTMPACVNVNSPTDPAGVQAECARSGRMSVCGFKPVEACQCQQGTCTDLSSKVEAR